MYTVTVTATFELDSESYPEVTSTEQAEAYAREAVTGLASSDFKYHVTGEPGPYVEPQQTTYESDGKGHQLY